MPPVTGLSADLLPHRDWAISKWFYANPLWYYHRKGSNGEIIADRKFFSLVDPDLRDVCHLLNSAGLQTTPSCQGHFYDRNRFENIWTILTRERMLIQSDGLIVKDSETDEEFLFRDPEFALPWHTFDDFYSRASHHQGTGYLGFLIPPERQVLTERFRHSYRTPCARLWEDPELSRTLGGDMFHIILHIPGPAERSEQWRQFTEWVRSRLSDRSA